MINIIKNAECFLMKQTAVSIRDSVSNINKNNAISMDKELLSNLLYKQIDEVKCKYFITLHFTEWDNNHLRFDIDTIRSYWDINAVRKTNQHIKNLIYEAFDKKRRDLNFFFFIERHEHEDPNKKGKFHIHFLMNDIPDNAVEEPNRKCRFLMEQDNNRGLPIQNSVYMDLEEMKTDLLEVCIRQAETIGKWRPSVDIQVLETDLDRRNVLDYCLKQVYNNSKNLLEIIDFQNSNFYKPE